MALQTSANASVMSGPTTVMAMAHPYVTPAYAPIPGVPIGIDIYSRELVNFDPWWLKKEGIINSAYGILIGPKGHGKSATMKIIASLLMLIAAGKGQMRVMINDFKPEGQGSEYSRLTAQLRATVYTVNDMQVNPFEGKLFRRNNGDDTHEIGILDMAQMMAEHHHKDNLRGAYFMALRIAIHVMLKQSELLWSVPMLHKILRSITADQIQAYYDELDKKLEHALLERIDQAHGDDNASKTEIETQLRDLVTARDNYDVAEIQRAGDYVASLIGQVLTGVAANMFGNKHSLYDVYSQRIVTRDWRDVKPEAESLMRKIDNSLTRTFVETNRDDMQAHLIIDDEMHRSIEDISSLRSYSYRSEIARASHTCALSASHRFGSFRNGAVGDERWNLGNRIIQNSGFYIVGRQEDDKEILGEIRDVLRIPHRQANILPLLPKYVFGLKYGDEPLRFVRIVSPQPVLSILPTDIATDKMLTRPDVYDDEQVREFARLNSLALAGELSPIA